MIRRIRDAIAAAEDPIVMVMAVLSLPFAVFCIISLAVTGGQW